MASSFPSLVSYLVEFQRRWEVAGWENRGKVASNLLREARPDLYEGIASGVGASIDPWGHNDLVEPFFEWLAIKWLEEQAPEGPAWSYASPAGRVGTYLYQLPDGAVSGLEIVRPGDYWADEGIRWYGPIEAPRFCAPWPEGARLEPPVLGAATVSRLLPEDVCSPPEPEEDSVTNQAVRKLLFLVAIEGISSLSRGGKGCVFEAVEFLRPDIAKQWADGADPHHLLGAYFPDPCEPGSHVLIISKHTGRPIGCMNEPNHDALRHAQREDPGCTFVPVEPAECPVCGPKAEDEEPPNIFPAQRFSDRLGGGYEKVFFFGGRKYRARMRPGSSPTLEIVDVGNGPWLAVSIGSHAPLPHAVLGAALDEIELAMRAEAKAED